MTTPLKGNKLYPDIPTSSLLMSGTKRKGGEGVLEKENERKEDMAKKKMKVMPDSNRVALLNQAIEKECKMRDAANKLLGLSNNNLQSMEASKGLFVSNMKILELMKDLQHVKDGSFPETCPDMTDGRDDIRPCLARIGLSDIRIPLEWKEFEQMKGKIDPSTKYGVFCLFRLGNQVVDTQTLVVVDRSMTDISFPDVIVFPDMVDPDFCVKMELYCSVPAEPHPPSTPTSTASSSTSVKGSTPIKVLRKIKRDFSLDHFTGSPSSGLSVSTSTLSLSPYVPHMQNVTPTHNYALAGHTKFTLQDVSGSCCTYNLTVGAVGASGTAASSSSTGNHPLLPLWGQICCKIMAEPTCATQPRSTGFINLQQMISGYPAWERLWCVLRQQHLRCWSYPEDVGRKMPVKTIDFTKEMSVENAPRLTMRRPNTLLLKDHETDREIFLSFESKEERDQWSTVIRQAIVDLKVWKDSTSYVIQNKANKYYNDSDFDGLSGFSRNTSMAHQYTRSAEQTVL